MAFKLALTAGHYINTPGKRCLKSLDPNETREWWLNDRIADKIMSLLSAYDGIEILRTDDTTGKTDISLSDRTTKANNFKADFYLSIHHNAGVNGGSGGGIQAYVYTSVDSVTLAWQKELYDELIKLTGLKGNRATTLPKANLHEVRETKMSAVLLELGFMDSTTDVPIILTDDYATKCAKAIVEVIVNRAGLVKKQSGGSTTAQSFRVKVNAKTPIFKDAGMIGSAGIYTITEDKNGMGRLKSGQGWINLSGTTKL